jgi:hypothetical protein
VAKHRYDLGNVRNLDELIDPDEGGEKLRQPYRRIVGIDLFRAGIRSITRRNTGEVYRRLRELELAIGGRELASITPEQVERLVGLRTNADPLDSREFDRIVERLRLHGIQDTLRGA